MKSHARVTNHEIVFTSDLARRIFMERNEGKGITLETDDAVSSNMRRYFEGCIVPVVFYTHPKSGWADLRDAREALKQEFLPSKLVKSITGDDWVKVVPSTAELSKTRFTSFLEAITRWLTDNQIATEHDLDSEAYKAWRDSAPAAGEVYPPLKRLKAFYLQNHGT